MKTIVPTLVLLVLIVESSLSAKTTGKPEKAPLIKSDVDAYNYLNRFGYNPCTAKSGVGKDGGPLLCQSTINGMLEEFQKKYKLPVTGKLDKKTAALMSAPRCGRADNVFKRAFVTANSWPKKSFTWKLVDQNLPSFGTAKALQEIRKSFDDWAKHAPLTFREVSQNEPADFNLAFVDRFHPEGRDFDEKDVTLAIAHFPPVGILRFNIRQNWTTAYDGKDINLRIVATHELGHALGLEHSNDASSIMFAIYRFKQAKDILPDDDRRGIQALYGARNAKATTTTTTATKKPPLVSQAWIPMSYGKIPLHAVVGGQENGRQVYVARVSMGDNNMVPGKLIEGSQTAEAVLFGVRTSAAYEIFAHSDPKRKIKWVSTAGTRVPKGAVLVGQSGRYHRYTGRLHHSSGSILLGKYVMPDGVFYYQYQGKEVAATDSFEVLCVV